MRYIFKVGNEVIRKDSSITGKIIEVIKESESCDSIRIKYSTGEIQSMRCCNNFFYSGYYNSKKYKYEEVFLRIGYYVFRWETAPSIVETDYGE